ncbi:MAG: ATP-binding protein [Clostridium sp.]|nr:ATP-binding protein [Clostridium sp.]
MLCLKNEKDLQILTSVFDTIKNGVLITSEFGNILYANPTMLELLGYNHNELINNNYHSIKELHWINQSLKNKEVVKIPCRKTGISKKYKVSLTIVENKYWIYVINENESSKFNKKYAVFKKLSASTLKRGKKLNEFYTLMNSMNDGVWIYNRQGQVVDVNRAAINFYGFDVNKKEYLTEACNIAKIVHLSNISGNLLVGDEIAVYKALRGEIVNNQEASIRNIKTGQILYVSLNASPIYNGSKVDGAVVVVRNINKRILARKQREELIKMQDEFIAIISHELRTPITVINSALQTILSLYRQDLTPKVERFLGKIKQNSLRLLRLVNNLLDVAKAQAGFIKPVYKNLDIIELTESIVSLVSLYANSMGINLSFTCKQKNLIIALDQEKYEKILLNLLSNSIKFTPRGHNIFVKIFQKAGKVNISVKDTGIGIPKENLSQIFDRFVQINSVLSRKTEGTGLGLSIVKMLVDSMEGAITVKSSEGKGSEFILSFSDKLLEDINSIDECQIMNPIEYLTEKANIEFSDIYPIQDKNSLD